MKFRNIISGIALGVVAAGFLSSCEDMMDLKSDSYVRDEDNTLSSANDSLYSAMGILTQLQKVGERYVLFGELRGDLMDATSQATTDMQEIASFNTSVDNSYSNRRDYYSIINNCNYALAKMDTTITEHQNRVMVPEYVAIRTIRAWTYLQMGLAYGRVRYVETPILSLEDSEKDYPMIELDELVDRLVADLDRYAAEKVPDYGINDGLNSRNFFIAPKLLLADLHLYRNEYAEAARFYYEYIRERNVMVTINYVNTWETLQMQAVKDLSFVYSYDGESIWEIPYSSDPRKMHPNLLNLTYSERPQLVPASWWVGYLDSQSHFHIDNSDIPSIQGFLEGDTRGHFVFANGLTQMASSFGTVAVGGVSTDMLINKFAETAEDCDLINPENSLASGLMMRKVTLYRNSHVYLRYAEALNRLGKHTLAFAVVKYGLKAAVVGDETKVDPAELADNLAWTNFSSTDFDQNIGTAARGRGLGIGLAQSTFVIPEFDTEEELTEWVEDAIVDEMGAETMFEGNRFFDLMRVSRHRGGTEYLADKVSRRFADREAARGRLLNRENWWLK